MNPLSRIADKFLGIVGNTKVFKYPLWLVYDPDQPKVDGDHILKVMSKVRPGDVIMRGWRHYLNGYFIPGDYSHGGICIGENKVIHAVPQGVVECNIIDFIMADRIIVLRPTHGQELALERAREAVANEVPYDFNMTEGDDAFYCFELCAYCYRPLAIERKRPELLSGLIKRKEPAWLSASFIESPDFAKVLEYNPDKGIDFMATPPCVTPSAPPQQNA